mmetsp:Transcript_33760/g.89399  ORF Transcript_33760/g.89399 Transcript_33760/m.89399 type:complete len:116 (+) Transcript_33760:468-815(+)
MTLRMMSALMVCWVGRFNHNVAVVLGWWLALKGVLQVSLRGGSGIPVPIVLELRQRSERERNNEVAQVGPGPTNSQLQARNVPSWEELGWGEGVLSLITSLEMLERGYRRFVGLF